jgi:hypothetical protein
VSEVFYKNNRSDSTKNYYFVNRMGIL